MSKNFQRDVHESGEHRRNHRGRRVAPRIEGRGEAPQQHEGRQPDGIGRQRDAGGIRHRPQ